MINISHSCLALLSGRCWAYFLHKILLLLLQRCGRKKCENRQIGSRTRTASNVFLRGLIKRLRYFSPRYHPYLSTLLSPLDIDLSSLQYEWPLYELISRCTKSSIRRNGDYSIVQYPYPLAMQQTHKHVEALFGSDQVRGQ